MEHSIETRAAAVYCTHSPCCECAAALADAGIAEFIYLHEYPDPAFMSNFEKSDILYRQIRSDTQDLRDLSLRFRSISSGDGSTATLNIFKLAAETAYLTEELSSTSPAQKQRKRHEILDLFGNLVQDKNKGLIFLA